MRSNVSRETNHGLYRQVKCHFNISNISTSTIDLNTTTKDKNKFGYIDYNHTSFLFVVFDTAVIKKLPLRYMPCNI